MDSLYEQFLFLVQSGDEAATSEFIEKHKNEFSEATKIAILGGTLAPRASRTESAQS